MFWDSEGAISDANDAFLKIVGYSREDLESDALNWPAMTPPELFLSSLGACAAYYAAEYLRARALPDEGLEIHVSGEKGDKPARIVSLRFDVLAPGLNQRHRDGLLRAVDACFLKHTLNKPPVMDVKVVSTEHEPASV